MCRFRGFKLGGSSNSWVNITTTSASTDDGKAAWKVAGFSNFATSHQMLEVFDVFFHPWVQLLHQLPSLAKFGIQTQPMRRIALHLGQRCTALTFQYPILYRPPVIFFPRSKSMQIPLLWLNLSRSSNPGMSHRVIWGAFPFLDYHQARF